MCNWKPVLCYYTVCVHLHLLSVSSAFSSFVYLLAQLFQYNQVGCASEHFFTVIIDIIIIIFPKFSGGIILGIAALSVCSLTCLIQVNVVSYRG